MARPLVINGTTYQYPDPGDPAGWGGAASDFAEAVSLHCLQKTGGTFTLTADVNFGGTYGLVSTYFKSRSANIAQAGVVRLANTDNVAWRNFANDGNINLVPDGDNDLTWATEKLATRPWVTSQIETKDTFIELNDTPANYTSQANKLPAVNVGENALEFISIANVNVDAAAAIAYSKLNLANSILNADINASAAIAYSKLNLSGTIVNADVNASAAIAYSKLSLTGTIVNADVNASAAIAYSKLALTNTILNADINDSAAIARSKVAVGSANHVVINDGTGVFSSEAALSKSRGGTGADNSSVTFPSTGTIVTRDATEEITNKTIASPTLSGTVAGNHTVSGEVTYSGTGANKQPTGTTAQRPGTPTSGMFRFNSESSQFEGYDGSAWGEIGGGSAGVNYIGDTNAESGVGSWTTYADAAATTPVDGTGGTANITFTQNTTTPLRGNADFKFTKDAVNRQGQGSSYDFTVDKADRNKVLGIWMDIDATDANYADDDLQVFIYDKDTSTLITPSSPSGAHKIKGNKYRFRCAFSPANTSSANYRLIIHVASTNATTYSVFFDNFEVGPGNNLQYGFDGIWKQYTEADATISSAQVGWVTDYGLLTPYKTSNGSWRLKFQIHGDYSPVSITSITVSIAGVTFSENAAITASLGSSAANQVLRASYGLVSSGNIQLFASSTGNTSEFYASGDVGLTGKPTWADFDPIATVYPTTDDLAGYTYIIDGQGSTGASNGVATDVGSDTITVGPGTYIMAYGAQGRVSYVTTSPTSVQYALNVLDAADASVAGVTSSMSPATSTLMRGNIDSKVEVTFTEEKTLNLSSTITVTGGGSVTLRNNFDGYITVTRKDTGALPPIGLELSDATKPGILRNGESGTYTPTITNVANVGGTITAYKTFYTLINGVVSVSGYAETSAATNATLHEIRVSLPIAATFSNTRDVSGISSVRRAGTYTNGGGVEASTTFNQALVRVFNSSGSGASHSYFFEFKYELD